MEEELAIILFRNLSPCSTSLLTSQWKSSSLWHRQRMGREKKGKRKEGEGKRRGREKKGKGKEGEGKRRGREKRGEGKEREGKRRGKEAAESKIRWL